MFHGAGEYNVDSDEWSSSSSNDDISVTSSEIRRQRVWEEEEALAKVEHDGIITGDPLQQENDPHEAAHVRSTESLSDRLSDAYVGSFQDRSLSLEETRDMILSNQHKTSSSPYGFLKPPLISDPAEIIVITTSLRGGVKSFFSSIRMIHLMNCKRVLWISIDMNKDVIYGRSLRNTELLKQWEAENLLDLNPDGKVMVSQCLIDGVSLGDVVDVAGLEEDGDLDYIINRERCPNCLGDRNSDRCYSCGANYRTLITPEIARSGGVIHNLGFEEVPYDAKAEDYPPRGNPKIHFTPIKEITSSVTF